MSVILIPLFHLVYTLLNIYFWILVASVIMSWLLAFGVVNTSNQFVSTLSDFLFRVTEPALRPIRKILPSFGGLDISPILLILAIHFLQEFLGLLAASLIGVAQ